MRTVSRLAWGAAMAGIAVCAAGAELDRATLRNPALAPLVPTPFRSFALGPLVDRAIDAGDVEAAQARASALVKARPIPAESLSKLGLAALAAGDQSRAVGALALSAQRGWRDALAQRVTAASAIEVGEWGVAADRTAALWQTGKAGDLDAELTRQVVGNPTARPAFLKRIALYPLVVGDFLAWAGSNLSSDLLGASVTSLRTAGARLDCGAIQDQSARMVGEGRVPQAAALWYGACTDGRSYSQTDFSFATSDAAASGPFDWSYPGVAGVERSFAEAPRGGFTLTYNNANPVRSPVASIVARLKPGAHRVRVLPGSGASEFYVTISCLEQGGRGSGGARLMLGSGAEPFEVPAQGCTAQRIVLLVPQGSGSLGGLAID